MENKIQANMNIDNFNEMTKMAWKKIMPLWPLKNLIACNPLHGFEDLPLEEALLEGYAHFEQKSLLVPMQAVNRETIKWCQSFFDQGQATLAMPYRSLGFYQAWKRLAIFDTSLHGKATEQLKWLVSLPQNPEEVIMDCLQKLHVPKSKYSLFLSLLLTTLPGWAGYIKYATDWNQGQYNFSYPISQTEYLAVRIIITYLLYPQAGALIKLYEQAKTEPNIIQDRIRKMECNEQHYQASLFNLLNKKTDNVSSKGPEKKAQVVFCIDVRSEPFRFALEKQGNYDTFGFAGFFGIPTCIDNQATGESYVSCPVLLIPKHHVKEKSLGTKEEINHDSKGKNQINMIRRAYQSLKYTFTTPFALVEILGFWDSLWMGFRTFFPITSLSLKEKILTYLRPKLPLEPSLTYEPDNYGIPFSDQCNYAEVALRMIGLTSHFAPIIVLCGHGSSTQNNAYASSLDCGACAGRHGASNAKILAAILNSFKVRDHLASKNINIPTVTKFIAAEHNTTTDEVIFYINKDNTDTAFLEKINTLKKDFEAARQYNTSWRSMKLGYKKDKGNCIEHTLKRSADWSQTRPEWGLARNASFIVGPRDLTRHIKLEGRAFMHSYDWQQDLDGASLTTILTAPMVVAQWINSQYLFSTLNPTLYGSGNKVTHNIQGKIGIMQGNASDLMPGLPLQSLYETDTKAYHEILRLLTLVYAPIEQLNKIISTQKVLQKLFKNGWVKLMCIHPKDQKTYQLQRDLSWKTIN